MLSLFISGLVKVYSAQMGKTRLAAERIITDVLTVQLLFFLSPGISAVFLAELPLVVFPLLFSFFLLVPFIKRVSPQHDDSCEASLKEHENKGYRNQTNNFHFYLPSFRKHFFFSSSYSLTLLKMLSKNHHLKANARSRSFGHSSQICHYQLYEIKVVKKEYI